MELNVRKRGYAVGTTQFDALFGFRYLNYDEVLFLEQALAVGGSAAGPGATVLGGGTALTSDMAARNRFYGFQVGGQFDTQIWDFTVGGRAKISIGGMNQDYAFAENVVGIANQPGIGGVAVDFNEVYPARAVRETRT
ncbi:MAG TPA: BBP7 family outer membrane beta-barrel protein, partial [Gemmatales bacterium]|nr:BBP7 family outer membrane beta-barrel protein [Gemmatales bacterium]